MKDDVYSRHPKTRVSLEPKHYRKLADWRGSPEQILIRKEALEGVINQIEKLPDDKKRIMYMKAMEYTDEEIAKASPGTRDAIKSTVKRIRAALYDTTDREKPASPTTTKHEQRRKTKQLRTNVRKVEDGIDLVVNCDISYSHPTVYCCEFEFDGNEYRITTMGKRAGPYISSIFSYLKFSGKRYGMYGSEGLFQRGVVQDDYEKCEGQIQLLENGRAKRKETLYITIDHEGNFTGKNFDNTFITTIPTPLSTENIAGLVFHLRNLTL